MYNLLSETLILLSEKGTDAMWPEAPAWTWWSLAAVVAALLVVVPCWRAVGKLFRQGRPKSGLIPLIKGIDMAWSRMGDVSAPHHMEGKKIFRDLTHQMFNGTDDAVRLYGIRPPLQSPALITNAHGVPISGGWQRQTSVQRRRPGGGPVCSPCRGETLGEAYVGEQTQSHAETEVAWVTVPEWRNRTR